MVRPTIDQARSWRGLTLVAIGDEPVGRIETIYVDRSTRQPEWALIDTGRFGSSRTFVPLADAAQRGDTVQVPHEPTVVREAPRLDQHAELSKEDETRLYAHFGIAYTTDESTTEPPASTARLEADARVGTSWTEGATGAARKAVQAGQQAAASSRMAVHKARREVTAVVAAIETTPESKRKAQRRARARKRAMAVAAAAARSVTAAMAAAWRRVRKAGTGQRTRRVTPGGDS
jgi:PRC-barrel domain